MSNSEKQGIVDSIIKNHLQRADDEYTIGEVCFLNKGRSEEEILSLERAQDYSIYKQTPPDGGIFTSDQSIISDALKICRKTLVEYIADPEPYGTWLEEAALARLPKTADFLAVSGWCLDYHGEGIVNVPSQNIWWSRMHCDYKIKSNIAKYLDGRSDEGWILREPLLLIKQTLEACIVQRT